MTTNKTEPICPYCGTETKINKRTRRITCECKRLHKYLFGGGGYTVLYKKDGTKEIIRNETIDY